LSVTLQAHGCGHNRGMAADPAPLTDADLDTLQDLLGQVPAPLEPLDVMALDGYLCGVILQPRAIAAAAWQGHVLDLEGRTPPAGWDARPLMALVHRRHAELQRAIAARDWFDPWIYPDEDDHSAPSASVLPWVAGFAAALELFPALLALDAPELVEPLALVYLHFDPEDLDDADALAAVIETIEPPSDLAEAVQDLVRAVMLIADVTLPRRPAAPPARGPRGARTGQPSTRPGPATKRRR